MDPRVSAPPEEDGRGNSEKTNTCLPWQVVEYLREREENKNKKKKSE
jgi:hypothetical protein